MSVRVIRLDRDEEKRRVLQLTERFSSSAVPLDVVDVFNARKASRQRPLMFLLAVRLGASGSWSATLFIELRSVLSKSC